MVVDRNTTRCALPMARPRLTQMMLGHATRRPNAADPSPRIASWRMPIALAVLLLCGTPAFSEEAPPPPGKPELTALSLAELATIRVTAVSKPPEQHRPSPPPLSLIPPAHT